MDPIVYIGCHGGAGVLVSSTDLLVVGGGVVGLWTALLAAQAGLGVTVVEEAPGLGRGASGHNAGVIHVLQTPFGTLKSRLAVRGAREYPRWAERLGFTLVPTKLALVPRGGPLGILTPHLASLLLSTRGFSARTVEGRLLAEECPGVSRSARAGVVVEGYGVVDPVEVLEVLEERLTALGVEMVFSCRAERLETQPGEGRVGVETTCGKWSARAVVVAAGAGTAALARASGHWAPRQRLAKGVMARVSTSVSCILAWLPLRPPRRTKGGGVIPCPRGGSLWGPDFRDTGDPWDRRFTRRDLEGLVERYRGLVEGEPRVLGGLAGTRVVNVPRDDFLLSSPAPGVVYAFGVDSPGLTAAPLLASMLLARVGVRV